jgi:hypothetical protein
LNQIRNLTYRWPIWSCVNDDKFAESCLSMHWWLIKVRSCSMALWQPLFNNQQYSSRQIKWLGGITKIWFRQFSDSYHFTLLALWTATNVYAGQSEHHFVDALINFIWQCCIRVD